MNTIVDAYEAVCDAVVLDPGISRNDAGVIVEGFGPTMAGAEARDWLNAIALEYFGLGIVATPGSFARWKDEIVIVGTATSINLFDALLSRINSLSETIPVNDAITIESLTQELATIPTNILALEGFKTGDAQLDAALDIAINSLLARANEINQQLGN